MREKLEILENSNLDIAKLTGYNPNLTAVQQFVIGRIRGKELWLLFNSFPSQIAPISGNTKFRVFTLKNPQDMASALEIWAHSCKHHETVLEIYSLEDLGID